MGGTVKTLGILAGVLGVLAGVLAMVVGGAAAGLGQDGGGEVVVLGVLAILVAALGIVVAFSRWQRVWAWMLLVALLGMLFIGLFFAPSAILFLVAGVVASTQRRREPTVRMSAAEAERLRALDPSGSE